MYHHRCNFMLSVGENAFKLCIAANDPSQIGRFSNRSSPADDQQHIWDVDIPNWTPITGALNYIGG